MYVLRSYVPFIENDDSPDEVDNFDTFDEPVTYTPTTREITKVDKKSNNEYFKKDRPARSMFFLFLALLPKVAPLTVGKTFGNSLKKSFYQEIYDFSRRDSTGMRSLIPNDTAFEEILNITDPSKYNHFNVKLIVVWFNKYGKKILRKLDAKEKVYFKAICDLIAGNKKDDIDKSYDFILSNFKKIPQRKLHHLYKDLYVQVKEEEVQSIPEKNLVIMLKKLIRTKLVVPQDEMYKMKMRIKTFSSEKSKKDAGKLFQMYSEICKKVSNDQMEILKEMWGKHKLKEVEDVKKVKAIMKKYHLYDNIDDGFVGKVAISKNGKSLDYYTKYGELLNNDIGINVVMNPEYKRMKIGEPFYCTYYPRLGTVNSKPKYAYTVKHKNVEYRMKTHKRCDRDIKNVPNVIKQCDALIQEFLTTIRKGTLKDVGKDYRAWWRKRLSAIVVKTIALTGARTDSIVHLRWKNISIDSSSLTFSYKGKGGKRQKHMNITDKPLVRSYKALKKYWYPNRKGEFIFSLEEGKRSIGPQDPRKILKENKVERLDMFRKFWARDIFTKETAKVTSNPKAAFDKAVKKVALYLGNTTSTALRNYICPDLIQEFWGRFPETKLPRNVREVLSDWEAGRLVIDGESEEDL